MSETIPQLIRDQALRYPDREALVDDRQRLTYAELDQQVLRVCRSAIQHGIQRGDHVAIWAPNSVTYLVLFSGLMAAGAAVVPINTRFKGAEAATALRRSRAKLLLTVTEFLGLDYVQLLRNAGPDTAEFPIITLDDGHLRDPAVTSWTDFWAAGEAATEEVALERIASVQPADTAYVILTSGTTGEPKGVQLAHAANLGCSQSLVWSYGLVDKERIFIVLPFFNIFGLNGGYLAVLLLGGCGVISSVFDPVEIMRVIERERITFLPGPPTIHQGILDAPDREKFDLSSLRSVLVGSTAVPANLLARIIDEGLASSVVTGYGLTEAGGTVALTRAGAPPEEVAAWAGTLVPGVELKVVDEDGQELPHGEQGEFLVRSSTLMSGYVADPDATAAAIDAEGWLHTGDIGIRDEQGRVRVTDRKKDMFIVGGFNTYPAEIEQILCQHPGIAKVAVVGMPDARMGEVGVAYVVPRDPALEPHDVIAWARANMANYKVPRHVELRDSLPMTASLKVMKEPLRQHARSTGEAAGATA